MSGPNSLEEFSKRYIENTRVEGVGVDTRTILPCAFCAAPDWLVYPVTAGLDNYQKIQEPKTCSNCGRTARLIITRTAGGLTQELVQTAGDDPPEWLQPKPRRVSQGT